MNVQELLSSYLVALEGANRAFERDLTARRSEPSKKFLKAQERLEEIQEAMEGFQIRPFTGWGLN